MMDFYTDVFALKGKIYFTGPGGSCKIDFKPSLYIPTKKKTGFQNMFGHSLKELTFRSAHHMNKYRKDFKDVINIHGHYNPVIQYLHKTYRKDIDYDINRIKIQSIDIETTTTKGFPNPEEPLEEITLITLSNVMDDTSVTFSTLDADYDRVKKNYPGTEIYSFSTEEEMLKKFVTHFSHNYPHILTSWNGDFFDIPYLTNRCLGLLPKAYFERLSPWRLIKVTEKQDYDTGETIRDYEWMGIQLIDYLPLYKKFSQASPENYKLDTVSEYELGEKKVENPYGSFREFYEKDPTLFVEYNIKDALLINRLDRKRHLLAQIIDTAYYAKVNFKDVFSPMRVWDSLIHDYLFQKNVIVHNPPRKKLDHKILGAAVKEPIPGLYDWTVSFDAKALYPSIARSLNMSPETIVNDESIFKDALEGIYRLLDGYDVSEYLKEHNYSLSANGFYFRRDEMGLFPIMFSRIGGRRDAAKKRMLELEAFIKSHPDEVTPEMVSEKETMNSKQGSSKILNNSGYGVMAAEQFRFFDPRISEGITSTGQFVIKTAEKYLNLKLNEYFETEDVDYVLYSDTDSLFIKLGGVLSEKVKKEKTVFEITDFLDKFCKNKLADVLEHAMNNIGTRLNLFENHLYFKREMISSNHLMYKKKKYAVSVIDSEGIRYQKPEIKVKGIEIVRRSTPMIVRQYLRTSVNKILLEGYDSFYEYYQSIVRDWGNIPYQELMMGMGNNGMEKYSDVDTIYKKGTPFHVKASLIYNYFILKYHLDKKYELIKNKDKVKIVFLKMPNKLGIDTLAVLDDIPEEFGVSDMVDYDAHFEKTYLSTIKRLTDAIDWPLEKSYSIFD